AGGSHGRARLYVPALGAAAAHEAPAHGCGPREVFVGLGKSSEVTQERRAFSVAVYARRGDRVLVIEHKRLKTWLPIGGELEAGETPLEAAVRELREETGLAGNFRVLAGALDGVPPGLIGYEEHIAGSKGLHMNFVFVAEIAP